TRDVGDGDGVGGRPLKPGGRKSTGDQGKFQQPKREDREKGVRPLGCPSRFTTQCTTCLRWHPGIACWECHPPDTKPPDKDPHKEGDRPPEDKEEQPRRPGLRPRDSEGKAITGKVGGAVTNGGGGGFARSLTGAQVEFLSGGFNVNDDGDLPVGGSIGMFVAAGCLERDPCLRVGPRPDADAADSDVQAGLDKESAVWEPGNLAGLEAESAVWEPGELAWTPAACGMSQEGTLPRGI
ncbi:MAG: hypothetical protein QGI09_10735, partial [Dehalococcoidia bacterium]|nr:hypothetical protein [Dehalococcoidia bacterium]